MGHLPESFGVGRAPSALHRLDRRGRSVGRPSEPVPDAARRPRRLGVRSRGRRRGHSAAPAAVRRAAPGDGPAAPRVWVRAPATHTVENTGQNDRGESAVRRLYRLSPERQAPGAGLEAGVRAFCPAVEPHQGLARVGYGLREPPLQKSPVRKSTARARPAGPRRRGARGRRKVRPARLQRGRRVRARHSGPWALARRPSDRGF